MEMAIGEMKFLGWWLCLRQPDDRVCPRGFVQGLRVSNVFLFMGWRRTEPSHTRRPWREWDFRERPVRGFLFFEESIKKS